MQSGGSEHSQSFDDKISLKLSSFYKWGCPCCGPKDKIEKQAVHQSHRAKIKRELRKEIIDICEDD